jgi:hypothetical protein
MLQLSPLLVSTVKIQNMLQLSPLIGFYREDTKHVTVVSPYIGFYCEDNPNNPVIILRSRWLLH